jgi:hypothetical protein
MMQEDETLPNSERNAGLLKLTGKVQAIHPDQHSPTVAFNYTCRNEPLR